MGAILGASPDKQLEEDINELSCLFNDDHSDSFTEFVKAHNELSYNAIAAALSSSQIRKIRDTKKETFTYLFIRLCELFCNEHSLSAASVLTRLLPFLFESADLRNLLWSALLLRSKKSSSGLVLNSPHQLFQDYSIAESMMHSLTTNMFKKVSIVSEDAHSNPCENIWSAGVGVLEIPEPNLKLVINRCLHLRLLLTMIACDDRWLEALLQQMDNEHNLALFTSLLNTAIAPANLPINSKFKPYSIELKRLSMHILVVALTFHKKLHSKNIFAHYLSRIHLNHDFDYMLQQFHLLLCHVENSWTFGWNDKGSSIGNDESTYKQEILVLVYLTCSFNVKFMDYLIKSHALTDLIVDIIVFLLESKGIFAQTQTDIAIHVTCHLLLILSNERNFGVRMNKALDSSKRSQLSHLLDMPSHVTHADLLVLTFSSIICSPATQNGSSQDGCFLTVYGQTLMYIFVNMSPYIKSLGLAAASKLLHLLDAFSTIPVLTSSKVYCEMTSLLIEAINNLIQYQFDGNNALVYLLVRRKTICYELKKFNVSSDVYCLNCSDRSPTPRVINRTNICCLLYNDGEVLSGKDVNSIDEPPTHEWFISWRKQQISQINITDTLLSVLVPQIEAMCIDKNVIDESQLLEFIRDGTAVGLLPSPPPIVLRKQILDQQAYSAYHEYCWKLVSRKQNP